MNEADALLDAIFDNPDDDTPRLVYADWLQEHDFEDYAQFIRIAVLLKRNTLPPDERKNLRQHRHVLGQRIIKAYPESARIITGCNPPDGIPFERLRIDAASCLETRLGESPFFRPRRLLITSCCNTEQTLANFAYLKHVVSLECEGVVISGWGTDREDADWQPVSGVLLSAMAKSANLRKLEALKVEPLLVTTDELVRFAETPLAQQLDELWLWVQFPDGSREDLRAMKGFLKEKIQDFVAEHLTRFTPALGS